MKIVKEHINEKFSEHSDPIKDMGIGIRNQILNDLKEIGVSEKDVTFFDDNTFFLKKGRRYELDEFFQIQLKYFPKEKSQLLYDLVKTKKDVEEILDDAYANGIDKEDILQMVYYAFDGISYSDVRFNSAMQDYNVAKIYIQKLFRRRKRIEEEEQNNIYIFIGFTEKVPTVINGKKYYEDKLGTETLVKIDKYKVSDLMQVNAMKIRAKAQYEDGNIYMITIPKDFMDEDYYRKIPEEYYDIINKYKQRIG